MLEIRDLSVAYGMHRALHGAAAKVDKGEIVVVLGANGAGKSTLLRAVAGLSEGKVSGQVDFNGRSISGLPPDEIVERGVALVPEGRGIFGDLTVRENLLLGAYSNRARRREAENLARVHTLFPKLAEREGQVARTMSGGEQQMVAIGRAMMSEPEILMLDEPSLGLSPLLCKDLFRSLAQIRDAGLGVLLVEQNARQSLAIADRGYLLENGEVTGGGAAADMLHDPAVQAAYLGAAGHASGKVAAGAPPPATKPSGKVFIATGARAAGRADTSALAGENIDALVARASRPTPPAAKIPATPRSAAPAPTAQPAAKPAAQPADHGDRLAAMLAEMEAAARDARLPAKPTNGEAKPRETAPEDLPTIPVYRKSTLEIYRRDPGGALRKVEDR
jgi:branched-chain amino acid transport system ATP-binding protein